MPETMLHRLLAGMSPELGPDAYVYCQVPRGHVRTPGLQPFAIIAEQEGQTLITTKDEAKRLRLASEYPCRRITLNINSSLEAVGFLARIASELARHGISANCLSAYSHDHLFVPADRADDALQALHAMQRTATLIAPVTLTGKRVELQPLSWAHFDELAKLAADETIWRWYTHSFHTPEAFRKWMAGALDEQARGVSVPFATLDLSSKRLAGATRFMNIDQANRRAEIGSTWLAPEFQRTHINTEAKYLMFRHGFEVWRYNRVEFKTDSLNAPSRAAIARLGAKEEGTLRNHMVCESGRLRHSVYFSVTAEEWPAVKAGLEAKLTR